MHSEDGVVEAGEGVATHRGLVVEEIRQLAHVRRRVAVAVRRRRQEQHVALLHNEFEIPSLRGATARCAGCGELIARDGVNDLKVEVIARLPLVHPLRGAQGGGHRSDGIGARERSTHARTLEMPLLALPDSEPYTMRTRTFLPMADACMGVASMAMAIYCCAWEGRCRVQRVRRSSPAAGQDAGARDQMQK